MPTSMQAGDELAGRYRLDDLLADGGGGVGEEAGGQRRVGPADHVAQQTRVDDAAGLQEGDAVAGALDDVHDLVPLALERREHRVGAVRQPALADHAHGGRDRVVHRPVRSGGAGCNGECGEHPAPFVDADPGIPSLSAPRRVRRLDA